MLRTQSWFLIVICYGRNAQREKYHINNINKAYTQRSLKSWCGNAMCNFWCKKNITKANAVLILLQ